MPLKIQLQKGGNEISPLSWIEVFVMLQKGAIDYQTPARFEGDDAWRSIDELDLWREGDEVGPFTWEEIAYLVEQGCLDGRVQVRPEGSDELLALDDAARERFPSADLPTSPRSGFFFTRPPSWLTLAPVEQWLTLFGCLSRNRLVLSSLLYAALVLAGFSIGWLTRGSSRDSSPVPPEVSRELQASEPVARLDSPARSIPFEETTKNTSDIPKSEIHAEQEPDSETSGNTDSAEVVALTQPAQSPEMPREPVGEPKGLTNQLAAEVEPPLSPPNQALPTSKVESEQPANSPSPEPAANTQQGNPRTTTESTRAVVHPSNFTPGSALPRLDKFRPFETPQLTEQELEELLQERFSSLPIKIPDSYDERPGRGLLIHEGNFTLDTQLIHNPKVEVVYRVPLHSKNRPGPDADNIVMVGIYHGAIQPRAKKIVDGKEIVEKSRLHDALKPFADQLGYTAFTLHIATTPQMAADQREYYAYGGPDWVDVVYRAKAEIEKRHKLKERRILLFGASEGGQFVQNIAAADPEKVAAISTQSGPNITPPTRASDTAWFLAITRGDAMQSAYEAVYNRLLEQDGSVVFNIFPPDYRRRGLGGNFYHSQSTIATLASRSFLRGVVDRYDSKNAVNRSKWPYLRNRSKPLRIYPSGSPQAKSIPESNREYLPSRAFAQCLQAVPAPMQTVTFTTNGVRTVKAFVGIPPLGKARGIIIYSQAFNILDLQHLFDNIYYLAANGYVVIAPQMKKSDSYDILTAVEFASKSKVLGQLPMAIIGYGPKANLAWDVVARNTRIAPDAVAMMEFTPGDAFDESKLPPGCRMSAPIIFVYDEHPLVNVSTSDEAKKSVEMVTAVKTFVKKCNERKQLATVAIIPKPESKRDSTSVVSKESAKLERVRAAQLSLEAAERFITKVVENRTSEIEP